MSRDTLLCVANFPTNTGFAWDFLEGRYAVVADQLAGDGIRTLVAYPRIVDPPRSLAGSTAQPVELDASCSTMGLVFATARFARKEGVRGILAVDRPPRHWAYAVLRLVGVRRIVIYDQGSGDRSAGSGFRRALKWVYARLPGCAADIVLAVSDYVASQQADAWLTHPARIKRVWNGMELPQDPGPPGTAAHTIFRIAPERPLVMASSRAVRAKGVPVLLEAFDRLLQDWSTASARPALVYLGDGPAFAEFQALRDRLSAKDDIVMPGKRSDVLTLLRDATVAVVPSVWQEGFGLAALEPMSLGRPVVASRAGALPEIVRDGETGLLVPPGDVAALADALRQLLADPALCRRMGAAGRARVRAEFSLEEQVERLTEAVRPGFAGASAR